MCLSLCVWLSLSLSLCLSLSVCVSLFVCLFVYDTNNAASALEGTLLPGVYYLDIEEETQTNPHFTAGELVNLYSGRKQCFPFVLGIEAYLEHGTYALFFLSFVPSSFVCFFLPCFLSSFLCFCLMCMRRNAVEVECTSTCLNSFTILSSHIQPLVHTQEYVCIHKNIVGDLY